MHAIICKIRTLRLAGRNKFRFFALQLNIFKFHKVVRQQNSGVVEDFIYRIPQFSYESKIERNIEIGPRLSKLSWK